MFNRFSTLIAVTAVTGTLSGCGLKASLDWTAFGVNAVPTTVLTMVPAQGTSTGGFELSFTGTGFTNDTVTVKLGATACTPVTILSATSISCTVPMLPAGTYVATVSIGPSSITFPTSYTSVNGPTITSVSPTAGALAGGTILTIMGTGFQSGATIDLGAAGTCQSPVFLSSTQYQCTTPLASAGGVTLTLTNTDTQSASLASAYIYQAAPFIAGISPSGGALAGSTTLSITGTGFVSGAVVTVGGAPCSVVTVSPTLVTCTTPSGSSGAAFVIVKNSDGQTALSPSSYLYSAAPSITSVNPTAGALAGGTTLTINGSGFFGSSTITVGGSTCASVNLITANQLTCALPAGSGSASITVTNPDTQAGTLANAYTYQSAPTLSSVLPNDGTVGTAITLTGTGFVSGATATVGGTPCTTTTFVSATQINCTTPSHSVGSASIVVANLDGQSSSAVPYTYNVAPVLSGVSPSGGPIAGGNTLILTGSNFLAGATATVGGTPCTTTTFVSATQINCTAPLGIAGAKPVTVTNSDGQGTTLSSSYSYNPAPSITSISPTAGALSGGTSVTVTGNGFLTGATVTIGGSTCTSPSVSSSTITCTLPTHSAGPATVHVVNLDTQSGDLVNGYSYNSAPTLSGVLPTAGPVTGGTAITLTGTGFLSGATVSFTGSACTSVNVVSSTQLTCSTPALSAGTRSISIVNPDGQSDLGLSFTHNAAPTLSSITPTGGAFAGGTTLTLNGSGFISGATIMVGATPCTSVNFINSTQLTCTTPSGTGVKSVAVSNPDSQTASLTSAYTYQNAPTLTLVSPTSGALAGGTTITLSGTDFLNGALISIGGSACLSPTFVNSTTLTCVTPSHIAGLVNIQVINPDNQFGDLVGGYTYNPAPTLTSIAPGSGPLAGGTSVTLSGTGFITGATATINGFICGSPNVVSSISMTCLTPSNSAGSYSATVNNPDGQSASGGTFVYNSAPTLTSVSPTAGALAGGTTITLTGTGFVSGATVAVGGTSCGSVNFIGSTQISCVTPSSSSGAMTVTVTNPDTQNANLASAFTYQPAPTVSSVFPLTVASPGGTTVTITGTGFLTGATVVAGSTCTSVNVVSPTQITCVNTPAGAGSYPVVVTNTDGQTSGSATLLAYAAQPVVGSLSVSGGSTSGGTTLTISGANFVSPTVTIGGISCSIGTSNSSSITCTTGANTPGTYLVVVTNGTGVVSSGGQSFTYAAPPTLTSISPVGGPLAGGTTVTFTGTGFVTGATATFGGTACTVPTFLNSTTFTCTAPASGAGSVDVTIKNPDTQSATLTSAYAFAPAPFISGILPSAGSTSGGTLVTVSGTDFATSGTVTVSVGGVSCGNVYVASSGVLTCKTSAHSSGNADITVTNPDTQTNTLVSGYTYQTPAAYAFNWIGGLMSIAQSWITGIEPSGGKSDGTLTTATGGFITGDGTYLYVTDRGNDRIVKINASTGTVVGWIGSAGSLLPTGGASGCTSLTPSNPLPGWCTGGAAGIGSPGGFGTGRLTTPGQVMYYSGKLYVADTGNFRIARFDAATGAFEAWIGKIGATIPTADANCVSPVANTATPGWCNGGVTTSGATDGSLQSPKGVATDGTFLYVSDSTNGRINRWMLNTGAYMGWQGKISTSPTGGDPGCNGASTGGATPGWCTGGATAAGTGDGMFSSPAGLWTTVDSLMVADTSNNRVQRFYFPTATWGWIGYVATSPTGGASGCSGLSASSITPGWCTGGTAQATVAKQGSPASINAITVAATGELYGVGANFGALQKWDSTTGASSAWTGQIGASISGISCLTGSPAVNSPTPSWCTGGTLGAGTLNDGSLKAPAGVWADSTVGKVYVLDSLSRVSRFSMSTGTFDAWWGGQLSLLAGWSTSGGTGKSVQDGGFNVPRGVANDGTYLYVADSSVSRVSRILISSGAPGGWIGGATGPAVSGTAGCTSMVANGVTPGWCNGGYSAGVSSTSSGGMSGPSHLVAVAGNLYVVDSGNSRINRYSAGTGTFSGWIGMVASISGISCTGGTATVSSPSPGWCTGGATSSSSADGGLNQPYGIASDGTYLYVSEGAHRVSRFDIAAGTFQGAIGKTTASIATGACIGTTAGSAMPGWCTGGTLGSTGSGDGMFSAPKGLALGNGYLYVVDANNFRVQRFNSSTGAFAGWIGNASATPPTSGAPGCTTTSVNTAVPGWCYGGVSASAPAGNTGGFNQPLGIALDPNGYLYVSDSSLSRISRHLVGTGGPAGWYGKIGTVPTGGSAGCNVASVGSLTPGWCTGGVSAKGDGPGEINSPDQLFWLNGLYFGDAIGRISRITGLDGI